MVSDILCLYLLQVTQHLNNEITDVKSNKKDYIILLDNGHGENTQGKQSPDGLLKEYTYTREIVQRIYSSLKDLGYNPHILVPEINDIPLSIRVKRVN